MNINNPTFKLLRYFSFTSAMAIIVMTTTLAILYWQSATIGLTKQIEDQNVMLAQSFTNIIWPKYAEYVDSVSELDGDALRARPETREIHAILKKLTARLPVLKVKMYSLDALTVYSSEFSQMGASKKGNASFEATVRRGSPITKNSFRKTFLSFDGPVTNRHLVESYLPIHAPDGQVKGVFELYSDATPLIAKIKRTTTKVVLVLLSGLGLLYAVLFLIVKHADRIIKIQFTNLEQEILDRQSTELKYKAAKEEAETANLAKSNFLAAMSHEIRTPMAGVVGMADLMIDSDLSPQQRDWVTSIKTSGENLLRILNEILDQSKLEAGKLELSPTDIHLPSFIKNTSYLFGPKAEEKGLGLTVFIDDTLPDGIHVDSMRIGQILSNLLSNALKFTNEGRITVRIDRETGEGDDLILKISVIDTGIGLSKNAQGKLFTAFTQADNSTSRTYGGTGLGLSISKQLVELMGGEIGVESTKGVGSAFWFTVRYIPAKGTVEAPDKKHTGNRWVASRSLKVLVAEDNIINQQIIANILINMEHEVEVAADGKQAVEYLEAADFDIILMDIRMPVMDGLEATTIIRSMDTEKSNLPIIALTADIAMGNTKEYMDIGINSICAKPIDLPILLETINSLLDEEIHTSIPQSCCVDFQSGQGVF